MGSIIPYFYADLFARMVPGAVLMSLIILTNLPIPTPWIDFIKSLGSAQAIIVPMLLAVSAYVLGTVLEALLSCFLERIYIFVFSHIKYSSLYQEQNEIQINIKDIRPAKDLARASFGHLIISPSSNEKQAIPHILRFHAEGKMSFLSACVLCVFLVFAIVDKYLYTNCQLIMEIANPCLWFSIIVVTIIVLLFTTYQRLQSRAVFITRTIERSAAEKETSGTTKKLRDELLAFCNSQK